VNKIIILLLLFPFIPHVLPSDLQPFFIIGSIIYIAYYSQCRRIFLIAVVCLFIYHILQSSNIFSLKVYASIISYLLIFEVVRNFRLQDLSFSIGFYLYVSVFFGLVYGIDEEAFGQIRLCLELRNPYLDNYAQFTPEQSMFYMTMIFIYFIIYFKNIYNKKMLYYFTALLSVYLGNEMSLVIIVLPVLLEVFGWLSRGFMEKGALLKVIDYISLFLILLFGYIFLFNYDLFQVFLNHVHRSEQVRLYDIGQFYYGIANNFWGFYSTDIMYEKFNLSYPERFKTNDFGTTSALSKIIYEYGFIVFCFILLSIRKYFPYLGIFMISTITTLGLGWFLLVLMTVKEDCNK
jgi:hypothetical protein